MNESDSIDQVLLNKVHEAIEKNYADSGYGVKELALDVGLSRAHLYRKLHSLTGKAANQMIREFRLEKAFVLLQMRVGTISEIAYQVGFSSPSYFNTCFRDYFGYPPGKVKHLPSSGIQKKISIPRRFLYVTSAFGIIAILVLILSLNRTERNRVTIEANSTQISIAVLPFKSLSDDPEKQYQADGVMEAILLHLSKVQDLRVISRTSVEQYRGTIKTCTDICKELGVSYLLEGSFQHYGDHARLIVQLIHPEKEGHVWAGEFEREWKDIFIVQSEVAKTIASELRVVITPEEKHLIEKIPTTSVTAHDLYLRGRDEHFNYNVIINNLEALEKARSFYKNALSHDPKYARAYTGLGQIYLREHISERIYSENALDSVLILANKALSYDPQLDAAYILRGRYFQLGKSNYKQAIIEYDKAITLNPNEWTSYWFKGMLYFADDHVNSLANLYKAASLHRGSYLPMFYRRISEAYGTAGFKEQSDYYFDEFFKLKPDSAIYYYHRYLWPHYTGNYKKAIEFLEKSYALDSSDTEKEFYLGINHMLCGQFEESLEYLKIYNARSKALNRTDAHNVFRIGYAYWMNGFKDKAELYLAEGLDMLVGMIEEDRHFYHDYMTFYAFAAIYSFQGKKEKAYENLRLLNQRKIMPLWQVANIKDDPMFDSIRDEPEFQQIVRDVEAKYQAEHERVRQWMEENDIL